MMAEIVMKARLLRQKLRKNPAKVVEVHKSIDKLENEMVACLLKLDKCL